MAEEPSSPACPEADRLSRLAAKITIEGFLLWTISLSIATAKALGQPEPTFLHWALMNGAVGVSLYLALSVIRRRGQSTLSVTR